MSTPAGRSRRWRLSTVLLVGSTMSRRRLWIRISKCSRESLSTCGDRIRQKRRISVGSGTGPWTLAWVRTTVSTLFFVVWPMISWAEALSRIRIFCPLASATPRPVRPARRLLVDLRDAAGADGAAALADGEAQPLFHRDRGD